MKHGNCAICGGTLAKVLLEVREPDRFEKAAGISTEGYERYWVECGGCNAVSSITSTENAEKLKKLSSGYYEVDLNGGSVAEKYARVMALPPEESDNAQRVQRIRTFAQEWFRKQRDAAIPLRVLDIGAGTGVFLSRFLEADIEGGLHWSGVAIEPDPLACEHLRTLGQFEVVQSIFSGQREFCDFQLCTLNKVVEHIEEPVQFLRQVREALDPGSGIVYVEVPDRLTIAYRPPSDNILGALHHHLYDPYSLAYLVKSSGFEPIQIQRIFEPSGKISVTAFAALPSVVEKRARGNAL